jgi:endonuclease G
MRKYFLPFSLFVIILAVLVGFTWFQGVPPTAHNTNWNSKPGRDQHTDSSPAGDSNVPLGSAKAACKQHLFHGAQPTLPDRMRQKLTLVCYQGYASAASAISRTPIWSAEHLTAGSIDSARATERVSKFFAEPSLDPDARGELDDYRRSGLDRGHLSPSGDMPGREEQRESFSLANIAPQNSELNRGPWAELEGQVRDLAKSAGEAWVVTGVLFEGDQINTTPDGRVMVPTAFWKAVMIPGKGAVVYVAANTGAGAIDRVSLQEFQQRSGIVPFPQVSSHSSELEIN